MEPSYLENKLNAIIKAPDEQRGYLILQYADLAILYMDDWPKWQIRLMDKLPEEWHNEIRYAFKESWRL